ncbi:DNA-binding MarR family transcriptional regulator [Nocardia tenerifensis]|uniref:DNA-binding MarR family transcriptional regulator n=1 Tax=Nocardia tenerifensis TaxID=228006 RepID=A0A318JYM3_9NOCA|nr:MarR family transcriptional regulator [Nocardia tenerifensis]PXX59188.1 DNA-binding MarR family transcriptional regulator [Nocardia tenerifensis]
MQSADPDLPELLLRAAKRIRRNQVGRLAPLGLTPAQARALRIIAHENEPLKMTALAERLGIVPRSATTVVDALAAADLVSRAPDPANRRATLVTLTPSGHATLARMADARREAAEELFATLTDEQRETLRDLLALLDSPAG